MKLEQYVLDIQVDRVQVVTYKVCNIWIRLGVPYPGDTMDTTHFVIVKKVVSVTNDLIQIGHVETCEWHILYKEFV